MQWKVRSVGLFFLLLAFAVRPARAHVEISHVMFEPCADQERGAGGTGVASPCEYIILYNHTTNQVDLSGWTIRNAFQYIIPPGSVILPDGTLSIGYDSLCPSFKFNLSGGWSNPLDDNAGTVELWTATNSLEASVSYQRANGGAGDCLAQCFSDDVFSESCPTPDLSLLPGCLYIESFVNTPCYRRNSGVFDYVRIGSLCKDGINLKDWVLNGLELDDPPVVPDPNVPTSLAEFEFIIVGSASRESWQAEYRTLMSNEFYFEVSGRSFAIDDDIAEFVLTNRLGDVAANSGRTWQGDTVPGEAVRWDGATYVRDSNVSQRCDTLNLTGRVWLDENGNGAPDENLSAVGFENVPITMLVYDDIGGVITNVNNGAGFTTTTGGFFQASLPYQHELSSYGLTVRSFPTNQFGAICDGITFANGHNRFPTPPARRPIDDTYNDVALIPMTQIPNAVCDADLQAGCTEVDVFPGSLLIEGQQVEGGIDEFCLMFSGCGEATITGFNIDGFTSYQVFAGTSNVPILPGSSPVGSFSFEGGTPYRFEVMVDPPLLLDSVGIFGLPSPVAPTRYEYLIEISPPTNCTIQGVCAVQLPSNKVTIISCDAPPPPPPKMVQPLCPNVSVATVITVGRPGRCDEKISHVYFATDRSGGQRRSTQSWQRVDNENPVVVACAPDGVLPGDQIINSFALLGEPVGADNCDTNLSRVLIRSSQRGAICDMANPRRFEVTYRLEDDCGNLSEPCTQTVTFAENFTVNCVSLPSGGGLLSCVDATPPPEMVNPGVPGVVVQNMSLVENAGECDQVVTYIYTATDDFGNSKSSTQVWQFVDDEAPVITQCAPDGILSQADALASPTLLGNVQGVDNCDTNLTVLTSTVERGALCDAFDPLRLEVSYTLEDDCGNVSSSCTQVTTYAENFSVGCIELPDVGGLIPCDGQIPPPEEITSAISGIVVQTISTLTGMAGRCDETVSYVYQAQDRFGGSILSTQVWERFDNVRPVILECVPDAVLPRADAQSTPGLLDSVVATDNCDSNPTVMVSAVVETGLLCNPINPRRLQRTIVVEDQCGNMSLPCTQVIAFAENFSVGCVNLPDGGGGALSCEDEMPRPENVSPGIPGILIQTNIVVENQGACNESATYVYIAQDDFGGEIRSTQAWAFVDTKAPEILACAPSGILPSADALRAPALLGEAIGADNCDLALTVVRTATVEVGNLCNPANPRRLELTYVLEDDCGNQSDPCTQMITYAENFMVGCVDFPDGGGPRSCEGDLPFPVNIATEIPGIVIQTNVVMENQGACDESATYVYIAQDDFGGEARSTQVWERVDSQAPTISECPPSGVLPSANALGAPGSLGDVLGTDNCDLSLAVVTSVVVEVGELCNDANPRRLELTYTLVDDCGNVSAPCTQTITYAENFLANCIPLPTEGGDLLCTDEFPPPEDVTLTTAGLVVQTNIIVENQGRCDASITYIYIAQDNLGASRRSTQVWQRVDNENPSILRCAPNGVLPSFEALSSSALVGEVMGVDNCDRELMVVTSVVVEVGTLCDAGDPRRLELIYSLMDDCGNRSDPCTQTITYAENFSVACIDLPTDGGVVACPDELPAPEEVSLSVPGIVVQTNIVVENQGACDESATYVYLATDRFGVTKRSTQRWQRVDDEKPIIQECAPSRVLPMEEALALSSSPAEVLGSDNCDVDLTVESSVEQVGVLCDFSNPLRFVVTHSLLDDCGNRSAPCTQTITFAENFSVDCIDDGGTVQCDKEIPPPVEIETTVPDLVFDVNTVVENQGGCDESVTYIYTVQDGVGVPIHSTQVWRRVDNQEPVIAECAFSGVLPRADALRAPTLLGEVIGVDNCASDLTIITSMVEVGVLCDTVNPLRLEVSYSAEDNCGNRSEPCVQVIVFQENGEGACIVCESSDQSADTLLDLRPSDHLAMSFTAVGNAPGDSGGILVPPAGSTGTLPVRVTDSTRFVYTAGLENVHPWPIRVLQASMTGTSQNGTPVNVPSPGVATFLLPPGGTRVVQWQEDIPPGTVAPFRRLVEFEHRNQEGEVRISRVTVEYAVDNLPGTVGRRSVGGSIQSPSARTDVHSAPVSLIPVHLLDLAGHIVQTVQSDIDGRFQFFGVAAGSYRVQIEAGPGVNMTAAAFNALGLSDIIHVGLGDLPSLDLQVSYDADDIDLDGLLDGWEEAVGLSVTDVLDGHGSSDDPDQDGLSNVEEFIAGTDPLDRGSGLFLWFFGPDITPVGEAPTFQFPSQPNRWYVLDVTTSLPGGDWEPLVDQIKGTGDFLSVPLPSTDFRAIRIRSYSR